MTIEPVNLQATLATFDDLWRPRIVSQFNGYDVRVAKFRGQYVWHVHEGVDELFLVVDGTLTIRLRENGTVRTVTLRRGELFVVPRGTEHQPQAPDGASVLMIEPTGTLTVGDRHEDLPASIAATTGQRI